MSTMYFSFVLNLITYEMNICTPGIGLMIVRIVIIIITSLFREHDILNNTNYLSDIWSSMIKIMYSNYRQNCTIYTYTT